MVMLVVGALFTGCNQEEKEFLDAFVKTQEILSVEGTNEMTFNLSAEGLDEESQVMFDAVASQVNNMTLSLKQKSSANKDQTVAKAQIDANVLLNGASFDTSIWVDMDMSGDKPVLKEVFKLPPILMNMIPGAAGKEYVVLDLETMNQGMADLDPDMSESMNLDKTMAIAMKYQKKFTDGITNYMKAYDFNRPVVSKLDSKVVDGKTIKYYQVAFDNDSFKEFIEYTVNSILEDENMLPLFEEYMTEIMRASLADMPEEMPADMEAEMIDMLSFTDNTEEMIKAVKAFFQSTEDLVVLGKDGIRITFGINEDGYFVSEAGKMDFVINTKQIMDLMATAMGETPGLEMMATPTFKLSVAYDSAMKNINKNVKVTMPTTTKANAIDYMELIETIIAADEPGMVQEGPQERELIVIVEDEFVEFTNQPILVNNHYLVSTRDMADEFGATISWDQATKEIIIEKDDNRLTFNATTKQLVANGVVQDVKTDIVIERGVSYIPLRAIAENLGYTFEWDGANKMMIVYK